MTFGGSVCFGGTVGDSVSAGFAVSALLPLSAGVVVLSFSFSVVESVVLSVPAGRLLSAVGSATLSVTVAVILLSVLTAPLSVLSFVLSAAHPARLSIRRRIFNGETTLQYYDLQHGALYEIKPGR